MKKNKLITGAVLLGIATLTLTGCSEIPQEKIDAANVAIQGAKDSGASNYASNEFIALQDSMKSALASIEEENSKFFLFKNYDAPTKKLESVVVYAGEVAVLAEAKKEALKKEILVAINEINILIEENNQLIAAAPKGKEGDSALMAIKGELETIQVTVTESNGLLQRGELLASLEKAKAAKDKSIAINTELTDVISKYKGAKK
ncbi:MAG: hypothetical protein ACJA08_001013 [Cyclobacteriaceae bacterium]|jgi:hypothetical protein